MTHLNIKFKKLYESAQAPQRAHESDAGWDLHAHSIDWDNYGNMVINTGIAVAIPEGYAGFLYPRSSISKFDHYLTNSVGVIDSGYRGEIMAKFKPSSWFNIDDKEYGSYYQKGDKCLQLVIKEIPNVQWHQVFELPIADRGDKGYGSTGQ